MSEHWDVIIVGARCAGATLAATLARSGVRTLLLEADRRGTDMPMSTHYLQPPSMEVLDRLGVGERVRSVAPASNHFRLALDDVEVVAPTSPGRPGYCVRRGTLDPFLQDAAEASSAELRFGHKVVELTRDGERVTGVVVESARGRERLRADLVVGADGMRSTVARLSGAREYLGIDSSRGGYWAYYPAPAVWPHRWDTTLEHRADVLRYVFRADGDLLVLVSVPPLAEAESWGKAYRERLHTSLSESPVTRALTEGKEPVGKVMGLLRTRFFYREPVGPGWALVGDAGHYKDFVTGQGMTDALFDAERLARAIVSPLREAALEHFWRERDVATLPVHFDALAQGRVGYNSPIMRAIFRGIASSPDVLDRVRHVFDRTISPGELVPMSRMLRWMFAALLRGRFDVLGGFLDIGKSQSGETRELAARKELLQAARLVLREQSDHAARRAAQPGAAAAA
jgi:2-polyprenyl-6-methoxyphenol hydroxylase-like FAD-dependent oxidoreductase